MAKIMQIAESIRGVPCAYKQAHTNSAPGASEQQAQCRVITAPAMVLYEQRESSKWDYESDLVISCYISAD